MYVALNQNSNTISVNIKVNTKALFLLIYEEYILKIGNTLEKKMMTENIQNISINVTNLDDAMCTSVVYINKRNMHLTLKLIFHATSVTIKVPAKAIFLFIYVMFI